MGSTVNLSKPSVGQDFGTIWKLSRVNTQLLYKQGRNAQLRVQEQSARSGLEWKRGGHGVGRGGRSQSSKTMKCSQDPRETLLIHFGVAAPRIIMMTKYAP